MNTEYYRILLKVIETGNISKAAQLLGYTQSGISNIISKTEKQLGMKLFQRERTGMRLVEDAESLVPYMKKIVREEDAFLREVSHKISEQEVTIKIITMHSFAVTILPQLLQDFQKENPNVRFELKELNYYELIEQAMLDGEGEVAFTVYSDHPQIEYANLFKDDYYVVMPKGHPLACFDIIKPEQLKGHPFILPEEGIFNKEVEDIIATLEVNKNLATKPLDDLMILSLVEKGWGISIVSQQLTKLSNPDIVMAKLGEDYYRQVGMISIKDKKLSKQHKSFMSFVKKWFSDITF